MAKKVEIIASETKDANGEVTNPGLWEFKLHLISLIDNEYARIFGTKIDRTFNGLSSDSNIKWIVDENVFKPLEVFDFGLRHLTVETTEAIKAGIQIGAVNSNLRPIYSGLGRSSKRPVSSSPADPEDKNRPDYSMLQPMIAVPINKEVEEFKAQLSDFKKELEELRESNEKLKDILFNNVAEYGAESTTQLIPVNIYLDTNDNNLIYTAYQSVLDFLTEIGFETSVDFKARKGSWFKRWIANSKAAMTSDEVINRLREAEYAVEVNTILKPQSEVEKNQSEALVAILSSLQGIHNAAVRIGSLIVVKVTSPSGEVSVQTRTLSIAELHIINKHPELLQQPQQILAALNNYLQGNLPQQTGEDN